MKLLPLVSSLLLTVAVALAQAPAEKQAAPAPLRVKSGTISSDGATVLYVLTGGSSGADSVYERPVKGGPAKAISTTVGAVQTAQLSPDGRLIAFVNPVPSFKAQSELWVMNRDGSAPRQLTHTEEMNETNPVFSADGKFIAVLRGPKSFSSVKTKRTVIVINVADGTESAVLAPELEATVCARGADGHWLAGFASEDGQTPKLGKPVRVRELTPAGNVTPEFMKGVALRALADVTGISFVPSVGALWLRIQNKELSVAGPATNSTVENYFRVAGGSSANMDGWIVYRIEFSADGKKAIMTASRKEQPKETGLWLYDVDVGEWTAIAWQ